MPILLQIKQGELVFPKRTASIFTTYIVAESQQHIGIVRVVCDLHEGHKWQVLMGETFSKIIRDIYS